MILARRPVRCRSTAPAMLTRMEVGLYGPWRALARVRCKRRRLYDAFDTSGCAQAVARRRTRATGVSMSVGLGVGAISWGCQAWSSAAAWRARWRVTVDAPQYGQGAARSAPRSSLGPHRSGDHGSGQKDVHASALRRVVGPSLGARQPRPICRARNAAAADER